MEQKHVVLSLSLSINKIQYVSGTLTIFSPMHVLGFSILPARAPSFPDSFHSCNYLSSVSEEQWKTKQEKEKCEGG